MNEEIKTYWVSISKVEKYGNSDFLNGNVTGFFISDYSVGQALFSITEFLLVTTRIEYEVTKQDERHYILKPKSPELLDETDCKKLYIRITEK